MSADILLACTFSHLDKTLISAFSFQKHHEDSHAFVFVMDVAYADDIETNQKRNVTFFGYEQLGEERDLFLNCFKYLNAFELSNVAKYVALEQATKWQTSNEIIVYSDGDIMFFERMERFWHPIENGFHAVFTPHHLDFKEDREDFELLETGPINAGIFALNSKSPMVKKFLQKMSRDLSIYAFYSPNVMYADQPVLVNNAARLGALATNSSLAGVNVAYWNLKSRPLSIKDGKFYAGDQPLLCFHFSGFKLESPDQLTQHLPLNDFAEPQHAKLLSNYRRLYDTLGISVELRAGAKLLTTSRKSLFWRIFILKQEHPDIANSQIALWILNIFTSSLISFCRKLGNILIRNG